jgi:two-component system, chemotaxis family, chemotaxis protein CheY
VPVPINILIVDDSALMRKMIVRTMRLSGLPLGEVYEAGGGQEGLDVLAGRWVDLAIVDIALPSMSGIEMVDRIRQNPETAELAVILVSTDSSAAKIEILQQHGSEFEHKPFTPESLREGIGLVTGITLTE